MGQRYVSLSMSHGLHTTGTRLATAMVNRLAVMLMVFTQNAVFATRFHSNQCLVLMERDLLTASKSAGFHMDRIPCITGMKTVNGAFLDAGQMVLMRSAAIVGAEHTATFLAR